MGDRASVSFKRNDWESVTLFAQWGGKAFHTRARALGKELKARPDRGTPLSRRDPPTVMVEFIRREVKDEPEVTSNWYLGHDSADGDNSDNGHVTVNLT